MDQWYGGLPSHQTLTEYLNSKNVQYEDFNTPSRNKLATNSKTPAMDNLTPQYITDLLKPVAETHYRTLRSSVNGALAVPRSRSSLFDRSYSYTAPKLWNSIPIRNAQSQTRLCCVCYGGPHGRIVLYFTLIK